jgi:predicted alpha/beta hydrolase
MLQKSVAFRAADGYIIKGFVWRRSEGEPAERPVVIVNPANSALCRYYFRFASYLFDHGFDVIAFDYRGIGESRPVTWRGFDASWTDWGARDFEAVLRYAAAHFPGQPIYVVAHSIGGFLVGLAASNHLIRRVFMVGAQHAYWRDYAPGEKFRMIVKWHVAMPAIALLCGYFPGRRLGWLEDTPRGVALDWALSRKRLYHPQFSAVTAPMLAVSVTDDEFATVPAVERLLAYYTQSTRTHLRIAPAEVGEPEIGHFGFFRSRFEPKLWPIALEWLKHEKHIATYNSTSETHAHGAERPSARSAGGVDASQ